MSLTNTSIYTTTTVSLIERSTIVLAAMRIDYCITIALFRVASTHMQFAWDKCVQNGLSQPTFHVPRCRVIPRARVGFEAGQRRSRTRE